MSPRKHAEMSRNNCWCTQLPAPQDKREPQWKNSALTKAINILNDITTPHSNTLRNVLCCQLSTMLLYSSEITVKSDSLHYQESLPDFIKQVDNIDDAT